MLETIVMLMSICIGSSCQIKQVDLFRPDGTPDYSALMPMSCMMHAFEEITKPEYRRYRLDRVICLPSSRIKKDA